MSAQRTELWNGIETAIKERVLMLDGAMGTMLQKQQLCEPEFRGERFKDWPSPIKGNNDLLCLTRPEAVKKVHRAFLEAGSDLIETNSFNATSISQADYDMQDLAPEIARASAQIARDCADEYTAKTPDKPRAVLGAIGPLNKTLSISPKVEDPGYREVSFDEVKEAYKEQIAAFIDLVDALLIETVFDTLNAKAAIVAAREVFAQVGYEKPIMISGTITDRSGRTLSGQTTEAFWLSLAHAKPFAIGLNCALGADRSDLGLARGRMTVLSIFWAAAAALRLTTSRPSPNPSKMPSRARSAKSSRHCASPVSNPSRLRSEYGQDLRRNNPQARQVHRETAYVLCRHSAAHGRGSYQCLAQGL